MKTSVICSIGLIMTLSLAVVVIQSVDAKLYKDFDGGYITEQDYEERVVLCSDMRKSSEFNKTIDCASWVLTKEGKNAVIDYNIKLIEGDQKIMESLNKLQDTIEKLNEVHDKCIKMELGGKLEPGTCNK
jgi:hypothetical protein